MKNAITIDQLEAETALTLPDREMLLVTVVIGTIDILNDNEVTVNVTNNKVAIQVCAIVEAINTNLLDAPALSCVVGQ